MNNIERMYHAAARMLYHHSSDTRTVIACVRGLQGFCERWTAPTIMDAPDAFLAVLERVNPFPATEISIFRKRVARERRSFARAP